MKNVIEIPVVELQETDRIVTRTGKDYGIKQMEIARGCGNLHVVTDEHDNGQCYDRAGFVKVLVRPEPYVDSTTYASIMRGLADAKAGRVHYHYDIDGSDCDTPDIKDIPEDLPFNSGKPHLCSGNCCDHCHCVLREVWKN
jgi:hypothetical protein